MNIINLTPHALTIFDSDRRVVRIVEASGTVARVSVNRRLIAVEDGIEFYATTYGEPVGLPEPQPNTIYVVSGLLRAAVPERSDLWQPGELLRNDAGQPVGCIGLQQ